MVRGSEVCGSETAGNLVAQATEIRNLRYGERLPPDVGGLWPKLDPEWCWVALRNGKIVSSLVASPCHGLIMVASVNCLADARETLLPLLRKFVRDGMSRGFGGYMFFPLGVDKEKNLARLAKKAGATEFSGFSLVCGRFRDAVRW